MDINCFSLNNKYVNLSYSLLFFFTIVIFNTISNILIWKKKCVGKDLYQILIITLSIIFFHLIIDPCIQINMIKKDINKNDISKL